MTTRKNGTWETRQILDVPVSDIVCYDLDGDGMDEIAIIEGFHGDKALFSNKVQADMRGRWNCR